MKASYVRVIGVISALVFALPCMAWAAATVDYQGYLYHNPLGSPVVGGYVAAGTFAPGFDPSGYFDVFGDEDGNVAPDHYSNAVAAGAFRPVGPLVTTDGNGFFSGSGTSVEPAGTPIYLFGFPEHPDIGGIVGVLATSSDPTFLVPFDMGSTMLNAAAANDFVFGVPGPGGLALGILPFPEPGTCALSAIGAAMLITCGATRRRTTVIG